jgi:hypothetical protein
MGIVQLASSSRDRPAGINQSLAINRERDHMSRKSKKRRDSPEVIRKRLENSLPWSLSRWFARIMKRKK